MHASLVTCLGSDNNTHGTIAQTEANLTSRDSEENAQTKWVASVLQPKGEMEQMLPVPFPCPAPQLSTFHVTAKDNNKVGIN